MSYLITEGQSGLGFSTPLTKITKSIMEPFKIREKRKVAEQRLEVEESRWSREQQELERQRKEQERIRRQALRAELNKIIVRIRQLVSNFNANYGRIEQKARQEGHPLDDIQDLPDLVAEVMRSVAGLRMPDELVALEQAKVDTDGFLWVMDEANRRLRLYNLRQKQRIAHEAEKLELAEHRALLNEIAAQEAELREQREAFRRQAEVQKQQIKMLKDLKAELSRERENLRKMHELIVLGERELGIR